MKKRMLVLAGFMALSVACNAWAADPSPKIAYVDIAKVFNDFQKTKDNEQTLQEEGRKKEEERDALVHEIRQMKDEMALLSEEAKEKKQDGLEGKMRELQDFDRDAKAELGKKRNRLVREIFNDIDAAVKSYGEKKGFDFILNERALLYQNAKFDITGDLLADLNKGYSGKK